MLFGLGNASVADVTNDIILQHADDQYRRSLVDPVAYDRIGDFLKEGYPPASVMLHGVSLGIPLEDIVEMSIRHDVDNAQYFYDLASSLLPSLPGWVCRSRERYHPLINSDSDSAVGAGRLSDIAKRYFSGHFPGMRLPNWQAGERHLDVPVMELAQITKHQGHWYKSKGNNAGTQAGNNRPVFVSLYRDDQQIRTDADVNRLQAAIDAGQKTLPVVILFNETYQKSVDDIGEAANIRTIAQNFFTEGRELTSVPSWRTGDYHVDVDVNDLLEIFDLPTKDRVDAQRWLTLQNSVRESNSLQPFKVSLLREGERLWVDEPERLAVAVENGAQSVPVVFYFHAMSRMACGVQSTACQARLCDAAIAAGGDPSICNRSAGQQSSHQSGDEKNAALDVGDPIRVIAPPSTGFIAPPVVAPQLPTNPPAPPMTPTNASPS